MAEPRRPLNLLARGAIEIIINGAELVIRDEHGLLLRVHSAKAIAFHWNGDTEVYGDLTPEAKH